MNIVKAWTVFFDEELLHAGYEPNSEIGLYFEFYKDKNDISCELWAPIREKKMCQ
jgi:ribulose-5-phosphate 4-epimerase/fuculose-1-phosphate aldolase